MSPPASSSSEPAPPLAGHDLPGGTVALEPALIRLADAVIAALGSAPLALILGGSHATGEAVWIDRDGRRETLSDVDLWAVVPDETTRRAAARRLSAAGAELARAGRSLGFIAPVEVTLLTPVTLAALPARPASLELAARGRVIAGDPSWLARVPRHTPAGVSREETLLLVENRAFELLAAFLASSTTGGTAAGALRARHAVLKTALDLAAALALLQGELPIGAAARVRWGRDRLARDPALASLVATGLPELWDAGLAWRAGRVTALPPAEAAGEWRRAVVAWVAVWRHVSGTGAGDAVVNAVRLAARASWPRRIRRSLFPPAADAPSFARRWRAAPRGTPQHRLNASAAILLIAAASPGEPALDGGAVHALRVLDVVPDSGSWPACARILVRRWSDWVLDGRRAEPA